MKRALYTLATIGLGISGCGPKAATVQVPPTATPLEFIEKLAALVPPPRAHLTRFFGCLAPHAKIRSLIVPKREVPESETCDEGVKTPHLKTNRLSWAELLARVFQIDVLKCPCGGEYKIIAAILETGAIQKILRHLKVPDTPPAVAPSRVAQQMTFA